MWHFKRNIMKVNEDIITPTSSYCVTWEAHNLSNIKMGTTGFIDFTAMLNGRTISYLDGGITGFIVAGFTAANCSIPLTFTANKVSWSTDALPMTTDKVLTSLIYTVNIIFNDASEFDIYSGQTNAIVEPGTQLDSYYNSCPIS